MEVLILAKGLHFPRTNIEGFMVYIKNLIKATYDKINFTILSPIMEYASNDIRISSDTELKKYVTRYFLLEDDLKRIIVSMLHLINEHSFNAVISNIPPIPFFVSYTKILRQNIKTLVIFNRPPNQRAIKIFQLLNKLRIVNTYIATGLYTYLTLKRTINSNSLQFLPPAIDTDIYTPIREMQEQELIKNSYKGFKILYIGAIHRDRLPPEVIKIFLELRKKYPLIRFIVCTPDTELNKRYGLLLRDFFKNNKIGDVIIKNLTEKEKVLLYNIADVVIFPFYREFTAIDFPITILEAMSCAKPIIASSNNITGTLIVHGKNGFLYSTNDRYQLIRLIEGIIQGIYSLSSIGNAARNTVLNLCSYNIIRNRFLKILSK